MTGTYGYRRTARGWRTSAALAVAAVVVDAAAVAAVVVDAAAAAAVVVVDAADDDDTLVAAQGSRILGSEPLAVAGIGIFIDYGFFHGFMQTGILNELW